MDINKYDIVYVKDTYKQVRGSIQSFDRPAVVIQNNKGNQHAPTTIIAYITSQIKREDLPTHVILEGYKLYRKSMVMLEPLKTVAKEDIVAKIDELHTKDRMSMDAALLVSLGFIDTERK